MMIITEKIQQSMVGTVRKTVEIDIELEKTIQDMADKKNWSFSYMSYVLLQQAAKEKLRKSKPEAKNNT